MEASSIEKIIEIDSHIGLSHKNLLTIHTIISTIIYPDYHHWSTVILNHHPQPPSSTIIFNHHLQPSSSTTIFNPHPQPITITIYLTFTVHQFNQTPDFIHNFSHSPGCAVSGLIADSKTMVDKARVEAQVLQRIQA
jgi:hypothetical protein